MENKRHEVEASTPFSESLIWQLNRDYYTQEGPKAWRDGTVPHHLTSSSGVGKTYAELIFAFLKDLANKGQKEKVYILELGAGHGRLAFHTIKHLERLTKQVGLDLPPYCYVLSDIVEQNLDFFRNHLQFQTYYEQGLLDLAYFDGIASTSIELRYSGDSISPKSLAQPLLVIANYFFDSIPNDLFYIKDKTISTCSITLETDDDPGYMDKATLIKSIETTYQNHPLETPPYEEAILNDILTEYQEMVFDTYIFFPHMGLRCLHNLQQLSQKGLMLISMDKGYHEIHDLENNKEPEMIAHGSLSFWVNYHALGAYCEKQNGKALFPSFSTFYLQLGCLMFLEESETYIETKVAYQRFVNDFGPDDFNGLKKLAYNHISRITLLELIGLLRLSAYDSTFFINVLPRLKQVSRQVTFNERKRLAQTMHQTWDMYFTLHESSDLAFEIGGMLYGFGFYEDALKYFQYSVDEFGEKADIFYNRALCFYHLRKDDLFLQTLKEAKAAFPDYENFKHLDRLDLGAA